MNIHFRIEYIDKDGDRVESTSATNDPKVLHELLDEYLKNNTKWDDCATGVGFHVTNECKCGLIPE